jgi:hypothetical protein
MTMESSQHIKNFKLAIEFKYLMAHAPRGSKIFNNNDIKV